MAQNNGHHAVRGHLMALILVPLESPFATYISDLVLVTYIMSPTVSKISRSRPIVQIFAVDTGCRSLTHSFGVNP